MAHCHLLCAAFYSDTLSQTRDAGAACGPVTPDGSLVAHVRVWRLPTAVSCTRRPPAGGYVPKPFSGPIADHHDPGPDQSTSHPIQRRSAGSVACSKLARIRRVIGAAV